MMILELLDCLSVNFLTFWLLLFIVIYALYPRRQRGVPDGPVLFPVVGNLPALAGSDIMAKFESLRRNYGDVFGLYFGKDLTVVLNGFEVIHDTLVKKGHLFSVRPRTDFHKMMFKNRGIVFANDKLWKEQRQFAQIALNEFGYNFNQKTIEERINEEIQFFMQRIESFKGPFDIRDTINLSVANVIAGILFGQRCSYDDPNFVSCLESVGEAAKLFARTSVLMNCVPFLQHLPGDLLSLKRIEEIRQKPKIFLDGFFENIKSTYNGCTMRNVTDLYLEKVIANEKEIEKNTFTETQMRAFMGELLSAGSETTATSIIWIILYLILYPDIQQRTHDCIDDIIGRYRTPTLDDRQKLPYVEAVILEGLRIASVAPLSVPHAVHEDVNYRGYTIPKDTTVLINLHSVLKDPTTWPQPGVFKPERFLDQDGWVVIPKQFIPFSIGRRSCLGETLARMELFLYVTTILQKFELLVPDGHSMPSTNGHLGMTYSPKPFLIIARQRN